jgi:ABC-type methionine transport system ATPase subunit
MIQKGVKLSFPLHLIKKPVIFTMAKKYNIMPNILEARVAETRGEMILELEGTEKNIEKGLQSLKDQGITVELIGKDVTE